MDLDEWADERSERDEVTDECLPIECDYIENTCKAEMQKAECKSKKYSIDPNFRLKKMNQSKSNQIKNSIKRRMNVNVIVEKIRLRPAKWILSVSFISINGNLVHYFISKHVISNIN